MNNKFLAKGILISIPFVLLILCLIIKLNLNDIVNSMPKCFILTNYGIYCPACGNTRCIASLLKLDIISALRRNPFLFGVILSSILLYIQKFTFIFFGKKISLIPQSKKFWIPLTIILIMFYILRIFFKFLR